VNGLWQEQFGYDGLGRLVATNEGDGVWRFFGYDGAGHRTLTIASEGYNMAGFGIEQAVGAATTSGSVGGAYIDGVNVDVTVVDGRGLAVQTRQLHRQLSGSTTQTLVRSATYNAYGETASESDARGNVTDYTYNAMGRLIEKKAPQVAWTSEAGAVANARPTETFVRPRISGDTQ
jgi:YD repeat-containing protein